jgi:hypothetical protein
MYTDSLENYVNVSSTSFCFITRFKIGIHGCRAERMLRQVSAPSRFSVSLVSVSCAYTGQFLPYYSLSLLPKLPSPARAEPGLEPSSTRDGGRASIKLKSPVTGKVQGARADI